MSYKSLGTTYRGWPPYGTAPKGTGKKTEKAPKQRPQPNKPPLLATLLHYWKMEESSASDRLDSIGSADLAQVGSPPQQTGVIDYGCGFASSDRISKATPPSSLKFTASRTIAGWYKHNSGGSAFGRIVGIDDLSANREYELIRSATYFEFDLFDTVSYSALYNFTAPVAGTWYFLAIGYDDAENLMGLSINAGAWATKDMTGKTPKTSTAVPFDMGGATGASTRWIAGVLDEFGVYSKFLSKAELKWLYNDGAGRALADFA